MTDSSSSVSPYEPWFASDMVGETGTDPNSIWIGGGSVGYVAQITREGGLTDVDWRHAALIAAAPDLIAALQDVAEYWAGGDIPADIYAGMRTAIAKATGGAP